MCIINGVGFKLVDGCARGKGRGSDLTSCPHSNTLRTRQNGRCFADDIFKCTFLNENVWIPIKISLKFVPKGPINNIPALVQIMTWRRPCDMPIADPMMVSLPTHHSASVTDLNSIIHLTPCYYRLDTKPYFASYQCKQHQRNCVVCHHSISQSSTECPLCASVGSISYPHWNCLDNIRFIRVHIFLFYSIFIFSIYSFFKN